MKNKILFLQCIKVLFYVSILYIFTSVQTTEIIRPFILRSIYRLFGFSVWIRLVRDRLQLHFSVFRNGFLYTHPSPCTHKHRDVDFKYCGKDCGDYNHWCIKMNKLLCHDYKAVCHISCIESYMFQRFVWDTNREKMKYVFFYRKGFLKDGTKKREVCSIPGRAVHL